MVSFSTVVILDIDVLLLKMLDTVDSMLDEACKSHRLRLRDACDVVLRLLGGPRVVVILGITSITITFSLNVSCWVARSAAFRDTARTP